MATISLRDFIDEMQILSDESQAFVSKATGELITVTHEDFAIVEEGEEAWREYSDLERDFYQKVKKILSSDEYLKLPSKYEVHEYQIMERFCLTFPNEDIGDVLLDRIRGSGAFRRFKETIYRYEIENDWYKFRDEAYKEIAISWLETHELAYTDDLNRRKI